MHRFLAIPLLLLALAVSAEDRPMLYMGGDGHAYAITKGAVLMHIHRDTQREVGIGIPQRVFESQTGIFASADDQIWLIERGVPTKIADGVVIEVGETEDGAYLFSWNDGLRVLFVPYR